jgi:hypothetical protein
MKRVLWAASVLVAAIILNIGWDVLPFHSGLIQYIQDHPSDAAGIMTALATLLLAVITLVVATANRSLAASTAVQASASMQTIAEMREDRELQWRPLVVMESVDAVNVRLRNVGKGPALVAYFAKPMPGLPGWRSTGRPVPLLAGADAILPSKPAPGDLPEKLFALAAGAKLSDVWIWKDYAGNWYRFSSDLLEPEPWIMSKKSPEPAWVTSARGVVTSDRASHC